MHYRINNQINGQDLGIYCGDSEADALNAMARDAGYLDFTGSRNEIVEDYTDTALIATEIPSR